MPETMTIQTANADETEQLGVDIGRRLKGGEVIELISDLGGGKTTFTKGIAFGAGSTDHVSSPTFTVSKVYGAPKFDIHHFDFYRLTEAGLIEHELADLLRDPKIVVIVEWGNIVQHVLPDERLTVELSQTDTMSREIHVTAHPSLNYVVDGT